MTLTMLLPRLLRRQFVQHRRQSHLLLSAPISRGLREIRHTEGEKELVVEGVKVESDRTARLVDVDRLAPQLMAQEGVHGSGHDCVGMPSKDCHPLCKLPFVNEIKHTGKKRS